MKWLKALILLSLRCIGAGSAGFVYSQGKTENKIYRYKNKKRVGSRYTSCTLPAQLLDFPGLTGFESCTRCCTAPAPDTPMT
jgi:hypothetical protein